MNLSQSKIQMGGGVVFKTRGGCRNQPRQVLTSATSETEVSETNMSETKGSESVIEEEKEKESLTRKKTDNDHFQPKMDRAETIAEYVFNGVLSRMDQGTTLKRTKKR